MTMTMTERKSGTSEVTAMSDRAYVVKYNGVPGAGKTHQMLNEVEHYLESGGDVSGFGLANFTTAGRRDAAEDLLLRLEDAANDDRIDVNIDFADSDDRRTVKSRCRTLHSWLLRELLLRGIVESPDHQVIQQGQEDDRLIPPEGADPQEEQILKEDMLDPFQDFSDRHPGLRYDPRLTRSKAEQAAMDVLDNNTASRGSATANQLFDLDSWLHQRYPPEDDMLEHVHEYPGRVDLPYNRQVEYLEDWWEYKAEHRELRMYQHHDYVHEALDRDVMPSMDMFAIDETQDLSPVEILVLRRLRDSGAVRKLVICGDVNQSIYSFKGADPRFFGGFGVDRFESLTESRRCPEQVTSVAQHIIAESPGRGENPDISTYDPGFGAPTGTVDRRSVRDDDALATTVHGLATQYSDDVDRGDTGAVMVLSRTNSYLRGMMGALNKTGVPWSTLDGWTPWDDAGMQLARTLRALRTGAGVSKRNLDALLRRLPRSAERLQRVNGSDMLDVGDRVAADVVRQMLPDGAGVTDIAEMLDLSDDRIRPDMLAAAARGTHDLTDPEMIRLGTIHSAKGLEAPAVAVLTDWSGKMMDAFRSGDDQHKAEEHRVAYVAVTRAKRELALLHGFYDGETAPMLDAETLRAAGVAGADGSTDSTTAVKTGGD